jgi:hypothetical protein
MAKTLITPQTAAAQSDSLDINIDNKPVTPAAFAQGNYPQGTTFRVTGGALGAGEYVKLQYNDGTDWRDATIEGNDAKILDEDNACATIYGRMTDVRVNKSATSSALGVEVC